MRAGQADNLRCKAPRRRPQVKKMWWQVCSANPGRRWIAESVVADAAGSVPSHPEWTHAADCPRDANARAKAGCCLCPCAVAARVTQAILPWQRLGYLHRSHSGLQWPQVSGVNAHKVSELGAPGCRQRPCQTTVAQGHDCEVLQCAGTAPFRRKAPAQPLQAAKVSGKTHRVIRAALVPASGGVFANLKIRLTPGAVVTNRIAYA